MLQTYLLAPRAEVVDYSMFKTLVNQKLVTNLLLGHETITGEIKPDGVKRALSEERLKAIKYEGQKKLPFTTVRVEDPRLIQDLETEGFICSSRQNRSQHYFHRRARCPRKGRGMNILSSHDEGEQTLNQLLAEMDGFDPNQGVIIMAAANRPEILDAALLRPGRFDRQVLVDRPDLKGREKILRLHAKKVTLSAAVDLGVVAAKTPGFVGADLANIVNEAALLAARQGKDAVEMADIDEAIERVIAGLQKKTRVISPKEKRTIAYHEAGHAIVAEVVPGADPVAKISIIPRGVAALGYTQQLPTEDRYLMTRSELLARIHVLLGGRVAEEMVLGDISTGAQNDLQKATEIARTMVTQFGMSEKIGLVSLEGQRTPLFLPVATPAAKEYSEQTAELVDTEIKKILSEIHGRVTEILRSRHAALDDVANLLLEKEIVERSQLQEILSRRRLEAA